MRRRVINRRRSKSRGSQPAGAFTITWRMVGISASAISPNTAVLIGTSRHIATPKVSRVSSSSIMAAYSLASTASRGKNTMPTAKFLASVTPASAATA